MNELEHEKRGQGPEARAQATRKRAEARAEAVVARAEARVMALIAEYCRRLESLGVPMPDMADARTLSDWEAIIAGLMERPLPAGFDHGLWQEMVAVLAYHKAERRGFGPGQAVDDWLEAERELALWKTPLAHPGG